MSAEFVPLADVLRGGAAPAPEPPAVAAPAGEERPPSSSADRPDAETDAALCDARLFRARLADAFDDTAARLVRELAAEVLARELQLAPCDLDRIVRRLCARAPVVRVRVAPADIARVTGVAVLADSALCAGDAIVELTGGALDARLGVRVAAVLEAFA